MEIRPIAVYRGPFGSKFGIPRQSSLAPELKGRIVFNEEFRIREALRGLEGFSRIWLIWGFSENKTSEWHPTVRPPRLGGNVSMGVFATRSPFRPNPLGLSCVTLDKVDGLELQVSGADLADGTPIYDIKPYVAYADAFPEAVSGFASVAPQRKLEVDIPEEIPLTAAQRTVLLEVLSLDPRPAYQDNPQKEYGLPFDGGDLRFKVEAGTLTVTDYIL